MKTKVGTALVLCTIAISLRADLVVMQNDDHYNGKVLSVTTNTLVLQSEVLGTVKLSRGKIANVIFGTNVVANPSPTALSSPAPADGTSPAKPKVTADGSASLRQLGAHTNLIEGVQAKFLSAAGPEATDKFNQMLNDLTTGKMNIADLRAQAKSAADQLRSFQREAGDDSSGMMNLYLSILDRFVQETGPSNNTATNSTAASPKPESQAVPDKP